MPGRPRSIRATSGRKARSRASPLGPSSHASTSWPAISSSRRGLGRAPALPPTTRTRGPRAAAGRVSPPLSPPAASGAGIAGSRTVNSLPWPGPALHTATDPPCSSTRRLTRARPSPRPPRERSRLCGSCTKRSKTRASRSVRIPWPVSRTRSTAVSPARSVMTVTRPEPGVYLSALSIRLFSTCSSRAVSPFTYTGEPSTTTVCRPVRPAWARASRQRPARARSSTGPRCSSILPEVARATSSRSSTSRRRCPVWRPMIATTWRMVSSPGRRSSTATALVSVPSGLRSPVDLEMRVIGQAGEGHGQRVGVEGHHEPPLALAQRRLRPRAVRDVGERAQDARLAVEHHDVGGEDGHALVAALDAEAALHAAYRPARPELADALLPLGRIHPEPELDRGAAEDLLPRVARGAQEGVVSVADPAVAEAGEAEDGGAQPEDRAELLPEAGRRRHRGKYGARGSTWQPRAPPGGAIVPAPTDPHFHKGVLPWRPWVTRSTSRTWSISGTATSRSWPGCSCRGATARSR